MNRVVCNLSVDVAVQPDGKFDVWISNEGCSGDHYTDVTADRVGQLVADEIEVRVECE